MLYHPGGNGIAFGQYAYCYAVCLALRDKSRHNRPYMAVLVQNRIVQINVGRVVLDRQMIAAIQPPGHPGVNPVVYNMHLLADGIPKR